MNQIFKYPRTNHIQGSKLQPGDEDLKNIPLSKLKDKYVIIEEKIDGANSGISFVNDKLMLQSRGHYLTGGYRERHFSLFKSWSSEYSEELKDVLENGRYIMFGEWMYAKHTVYYDSLPSYFLEYDIYDTEEREFLSTDERYMKLEIVRDFIHSVPILYNGLMSNVGNLYDLIARSEYIKKENRFESMKKYCESNNISYEQAIKETDLSPTMEGLYIKDESTGYVDARYKFIRSTFLTTVLDSNSHWIDRPIIPNKLK